MKKYPKYKDSGIEWIGEIPEEWEVVSLKRVLSENLKYGANEPSIYEDISSPRYIRITDFDNDGNLRQDTFKSLPYENAKEYLLTEGDVLFARSGATVGKTFIFRKYKGIACFAGYLIKATTDKNKLTSFYLYLYTKTNSYDNWKESIFNQATIQNIGADKYQFLPVTVPSLPEQKAIAAYLDHKTQLIDTLIEKKQQQIDLLKEQRTAVINQAVTKGLDPDVKMKDSGIEWIGEIPEHWEVIKLKWISKIKYGLGQPPKEKEGGLPLIRATNIERGKIIENNMFYVDQDDIPYERDPVLRTNDIIVVRSGAYTADSAIVPEKYDGAITGYDMVVRVTNCNPFYISYALLSNIVLINQLYLKKMRAAQPHLNAEELGETLFIIPKNKREQDKIILYLDDISNKIDYLINKIQSHISLLREYRTTLISEVVTGKIDVRNFNKETKKA